MGNYKHFVRADRKGEHDPLPVILEHVTHCTSFQENYPGLDGPESTNVKFLMRWNNSDSFCLDYTLLAPSNAPQAVPASVTGPTIIFVAFENMWTELSTTVGS